MKKLLVTAVGAAAALGAFATPISTQRFEDAAAREAIDITGLNTLAGGTYWSVGEGATNNTYAIEAAGGITCPMTIAEVSTTNALSIKTTFGNPLAVNAVDGGAPTAINTGIYFDSLVKFTVCDTDPQQDYNGAKIVMWLQEFENGNTTTTNLMVKAGSLSYDGLAVVSTGAVYKCGNAIGGDFADSWHRVTIKAIANITTSETVAVPGFAIYIDGNGENCTFIANTSTAKWDSTFTEQFTLNYVASDLNNSHALFPSIDQTTGNKTSVLGASFDGTGSITDLVFTDVAPAFAADPEPPVAPKATVDIDGNETEAATLAAAVTAANEASAGAVVKITLLEATEIDETLAFASAANVTLDFAGCVITNTAATAAISNSGNLTITNSSENVGGVYCTLMMNEESPTDVAALAASAGSVAIDGGTFWGLVNKGENATVTVSGGAFVDSNVFGYLAAGKTLEERADGLLYVVDASVEPTTYTVTFVANGGTPVPESQTIDAGGMVVPPGHMTKDGYIFIGWTLNGAAYNFDTPVTGDITLVASWEEMTWASLLGAAVDGAYQIDEANDMLRLQEGVLAGLATSGVTFKQTANIDMTGVTGFWGIGWFTSSDSKDASITASGNLPFSGTYDGQGYTLSNVTLVSHNYAGVFNNVDGTVKNLTVQNLGFSGTSSEWGCAIVGNAQGSALLENLTSAGSVWGNNANHNVAGTVVRAQNTVTIRGCVNNAPITANSRRLGGIISFTGNTAPTGTITIDSCTNNAALTIPSDASNANAGDRGVGGIIARPESIADGLVISNCANFGTLTNGKVPAKVGGIAGELNSENYVDGGGNTFLASLGPVGNYNSKTVTGLAFAVVSGDYLTTVTSLEAGNTYKVMAAGKTATYVFAAPGTIAFNTNLIQNVTFNITAPNLALTDATAGGVVTFTAATPEIPAGSSTVEVEAAADADPTTVAAGVEVAKPAAASAVDDAAYQAYFSKAATYSSETGKWTVTADFTEKVKGDAATTAAAIVSGTEASGNVTVPAGLYYKITTMTELGGTPTATLKDISTGSVQVTKPGKTQGFIKVEMNTAPIQ